MHSRAWVRIKTTCDFVFVTLVFTPLALNTFFLSSSAYTDTSFLHSIYHFRTDTRRAHTHTHIKNKRVSLLPVLPAEVEYLDSWAGVSRLKLVGWARSSTLKCHIEHTYTLTTILNRSAFFHSILLAQERKKKKKLKFTSRRHFWRFSNTYSLHSHQLHKSGYLIIPHSSKHSCATYYNSSSKCLMYTNSFTMKDLLTSLVHRIYPF